MDPDTEISTEVLSTTRRSLQAVAEHVLSAALHASTGRIGLRQTPGGFGTPAYPSAAGQRQVRVVGIDLVVSDDGGERTAPLTTLRDTAALADVEPGAPTDVYTPSTALDLDSALVLDAAAARRLADWYALVNGALERLRADHADERPSVVQLWPEHFDLASSMTGVNYGGSPDDDGHPLPYLYFGPHAPPPVDGGFWNEPFGASRSAVEIGGVAAAVAFFAEGRRRLGA
jgi:hypothetical protein